MRLCDYAAEGFHCGKEQHSNIAGPTEPFKRWRVVRTGFTCAGGESGLLLEFVLMLRWIC